MKFDFHNLKLFWFLIVMIQKYNHLYPVSIQID
jgi:hypothetical protein